MPLRTTRDTIQWDTLRAGVWYKKAGGHDKIFEQTKRKCCNSVSFYELVLERIIGSFVFFKLRENYDTCCK